MVVTGYDRLSPRIIGHHLPGGSVAHVGTTVEAEENGVVHRHVASSRARVCVVCVCVLPLLSRVGIESAERGCEVMAVFRLRCN